MSYISAHLYKNKITVWERDESDNNKLNHIVYKPELYFYTRSDSGDYLDMFGNHLIKHEFNSVKDLNEARQKHIKFINNNTLEEVSSSYYDEIKNRDYKLLLERGVDPKERKNYKQVTFVYEANIRADLKLLSKNYYKKPSPKLHITAYDIETDYDPAIGFARPMLDFDPETFLDIEPEVNTPYAPINSISIYNFWENKNYLIAVPPDRNSNDIDIDKFFDNINKIEPLDLPTNLKFVDTEKELLLEFLDIITDCDLLFGWNSETFDNPYIAQRIELILGHRHFKRLSFDHTEPPKYQKVERFGSEQVTIEFYGRTATDYMKIYKKFSFEEKPSYKLESIAEEELPKMRKLEYSGSLYDLYRNDFEKFVRYNIRDTEILYGFEDKLGFVQLANDIYHNSTGLFQHIFGTLKTTEQALINYCHYELDGIKVMDPPDPSTLPDDKIDGAYVINPKVGQHDNIGSIDMAALYPSSIRTNNISPDTIIGQFSNTKSDFHSIKTKSDELITIYFDVNCYCDGSKTLKAYEWADYLKSNNWSISGYGTVFNLNKKGILPSLLESWYEERKRTKKLSFEYYKQSDIENNIEKKLDLLAKSDYYNRIQMVNKLALNSAYGALCNLYFRFYDLRLGSSTTATGQELLKHQTAKVNELLTGKYDMFGDAIIYGDTDSTYFKTFAKDIQHAVKVGDAVGKKVNESFPKFVRDTFFCTSGFDDIITTDREIIGSSGIFIAKKLYIIHIIDNEGKKCDKIKAMGVSLKKSTLPKEFQRKLTTFVERILKKEDWESVSHDIVQYKTELADINNILRIGLPIGVNNIDKYTDDYENELNASIDKMNQYFTGKEYMKKEGKNDAWTARLPGNVAGSIHWNIARNENNDNESIEITSGTKIKIYYLTKKYHNKFKSIAIPTDTTEIPEWFILQYKSYIDIDAQLERLVDKPLQGIFKAIDKIIPSRQDLLIDDLLSF